MKILALASVWCSLICVLLSCQQDTSPQLTSSQDTRILVQQALDSIPLKEYSLIRNKERAAELTRLIAAENNLQTKINLSMDLAVELLRAGETAKAIEQFGLIAKIIQEYNVMLDDHTRRMLYSLLAITYMRHGEIENCVQNHNHETCFLPIQGKGVHTLPFGSENAILHFETCLKEFPNDLESRYLLNLAYMTLGRFPKDVPEEYRIPAEWFTSKVSMKKFEDIAGPLAVNRKGHAGGAVVEDLNNDGWLDIAITSMAVGENLVLYINNGDGSFTDATAAYGITGHQACLNLNATDFNNDGWVDLYLMRGAWYQKYGDVPNTLLMNTGKGGFVDVTMSAGLTHHAATQTSAWSDFNLDGWLDLIVANESLPGYNRGIDLYINNQDGTFRHASEEYGLNMNKFFKGCVAVDFNNDLYPDIYLTTLEEGNMLFMNKEGEGGKRVFQNVTTNAGVQQPMRSFPCWNFDFDNDGWEDIFVSSYDNIQTPATFWMNSKMGQTDLTFLPKLYRNNGDGTFTEKGKSMGLHEVAFTMGCNFGDINMDGFLDFYLSTGNPLFQSIVPNKMYLNMDGNHFEDVSYSGGFANIQKGHAVSFGDFDHDGDQDMYVVMGGAYDGDFFFNSLFENPNEANNNWVVLQLVGTTANKKAIGARVKIVVEEKGKLREIHRTITTGASFGNNSLALELGLRKAEKIQEVVVQWPCKDCAAQTFTGLELNHAYLLRQENESATAMSYQAVDMPKEDTEHHHHHGGH